MQLRGKSSIVTGGVRGIGRAIVARFLKEGAQVIVGDVISPQPDDALYRDANVRFVSCDIGDEAQAGNLVAEAVSAFGKLDVCVNNAGILKSVPFLEETVAQFDEVIRVNLRGQFILGQAAARQMVAQRGGGSIINISSINANIASHGQTSYAASKGGVRMLTRSMAVQLATHGIRVNAIGPGTIATEMAAPHIGPAILSRIPMARAGLPEEIAGAAVFLAGDDASYVTGQTIYVDGGRLALNMPPPEKTKSN
jgi:NAD(P)-dependent dehydrogenase (short-subunit alcohol dehydrogenase family)